jgi:outer membrane immunogenic protein
MKRTLFAFVSAVALAAGTQAFAADLPPRPAPMPQAPAFVPVPPFTWTAFYIGGNLGAGWNHGDITDNFGNTWGLNNTTTFVGGGQVGGNYQFNALVVGIEADFDWFANNNNSSGGVTVGNTTLQGSANGRWLTTVTGRLGWAVDRVLFYAKGGGAWVGANNLTILDVPTGASVAYGTSSTNTGWTAGAGVEWAFADNWSVKAEYDYVGLSNNSFTVPPGFFLSGDSLSTSNRNISLLTVGINYLFH